MSARPGYPFPYLLKVDSALNLREDFKVINILEVNRTQAIIYSNPVVLTERKTKVQGYRINLATKAELKLGFLIPIPLVQSPDSFLA